jgi:hypothetical protein
MAYFKTRMQGEPRAVAGSTAAANTGGVKMPNSGISVIGNTTSEVFVLAAPVTGCRKTIVITSLTTTVLPIIRTSSTSGADISFVGVTTGLNLLNILGPRSTALATVVELIGFNSTSWLLANVCPASSTLTVSSVLSISSGA